jgi:hypothetical protein
VHIEPGLVERERGSEAADPAPDDPHRKHILHVTNDTPDSGISHRRGGDDVVPERAGMSLEEADWRRETYVSAYALSAVGWPLIWAPTP